MWGGLVQAAKGLALGVWGASRPPVGGAGATPLAGVGGWPPLCGSRGRLPLAGSRGSAPGMNGPQVTPQRRTDVVPLSVISRLSPVLRTA